MKRTVDNDIIDINTKLEILKLRLLSVLAVVSKRYLHVEKLFRCLSFLF